MAVTGLVPAANGGMRCQTEICGAICCKTWSFRPDTPGPCEFLTEDLQCELHLVGGPPCKPMGCAQFPLSQADVDGMNAQLEALGVPERCLLGVE